MALTNQVVAPRYGKALFEAATDQQQLDDVRADVLSLQQVLEANQGLLKALDEPNLTSSHKASLIQTLITGASPLMTRLIALLQEYGRIGALADILTSFIAYADEAGGRIQASVTTAVPLSDDQRTALTAQIVKRYDAKSVDLVEKVDPLVLGGVRIVAQGQVIDGTLQTRYARLKAQLLSE